MPKICRMFSSSWDAEMSLKRCTLRKKVRNKNCLFLRVGKSDSAKIVLLNERLMRRGELFQEESSCLFSLGCLISVSPLATQHRGACFRWSPSPFTIRMLVFGKVPRLYKARVWRKCLESHFFPSKINFFLLRKFFRRVRIFEIFWRLKIK